MMGYLKLLQRRHLWIRFALVGGCGFIVDSIVFFSLLYIFQIELMISRSVAFFVAASSNWLLNRIYTFGSTSRTTLFFSQWLRFLLSALLSSIPNLSVFYILASNLPGTVIYTFPAMCAGILVGYFCNYQLARSWVYK